MALGYLIYVSQAEEGLDDDGLAEILTHSRSYNAAHDITGALLFVQGRDNRRGSFMQLLEGEPDEIERLRARIFADPRHHTKVVLEQGPLDSRKFADWSMSFRNVKPEALAAHPEFADMAEPAFLDRCLRSEVSKALPFLCEFWYSDPI
ncbi:BLUF domain-containing protein [Notoacmeibacter sp. MSK16QG-6]|nr:BLUF domain-containing protein [Notoacmeibacter sp. MSK16QG-6]